MLIIGAVGWGASEDSKRSASENNSQEAQLTSAQEAILESARYHINSEGISKTDLIQTLTAAGYTRADARFAANNVGAHWKDEAVEKARDRLDEDGLVMERRQPGRTPLVLL